MPRRDEHKGITIEVYQASLVIKERVVPLTRARAKQFPCYDWFEVSLKWYPPAEPTDIAPLCKVLGATLGCRKETRHDWYILVPDEIAGLAWIGVAERKESCWVDIAGERRVDREWQDIPTVILL